MIYIEGICSVVASTPVPLTSEREPILLKSVACPSPLALPSPATSPGPTVLNFVFTIHFLYTSHFYVSPNDALFIFAYIWTLYKWNHIAFTCLLFFTVHYVYEIHPG